MTEIDDKAKRYTVIKNRLALIEPVILLVFLVVMQISGISTFIKYISANLLPALYGTITIYGILFGLFYYVVTFYLNFYRGYIIEQRFGLSNQSLSSWLKDELKRIIISLILFLLFIEYLYFLIYNSPDLWWLFMGLGWVLLTILFAKIFPVLIIPLFFKYERLGDEELRMKLMELAKKCGIRLLDVFRLKLSAKTKKANAALAGLGKTRRILLGDTLLENYTKDEVGVVMAHELAHHKLAHIWKMVLFSGLSMLVIFYLLKLLSVALIDILHLESIKDIVAFPSILLLFTFFSIIILPLQNAFSRKLERSADSFALKITGLPEAFISCMNKLARQNLADPAPSRFIEIMLYDHPPISKRIRMAQNFKKVNAKTPNSAKAQNLAI